MDPNLFHLDWERVGEVLTAIVVLSFVLERALSLIFESTVFIKVFEGRGVKEWIAGAVCIAVCIIWKFDSISMIVLTDHTTVFGEIVTGAVVAGGSKASLKLFHDVLDVRSSAHEVAHPEDEKTGKPQPQVDRQAVATL
jgi:uncharacterized membrane protein